ncbi:3-hydroxyisobutyryl-CoA hydrolase [Brachybacterium vulturis]|uniref:3-hydroxyisobutyryl-CoA hydrolase n=1 Tax=Brachybacterium vulturis TaxID=2017484 RepID=A0A291GKL6_9MICO|nr:3-hydroxyisobutyryl-CoA hydrolase [Brachybacterium vulturis]ATG50514.1 3-hydroxyisobutyryl-CoA hydrolase [Brachybacterium vulturis]
MPAGTPDIAADDEVLIRRSGHLAELILHRPRALNALNRGMIDTVRAQLDAWREDDTVATVLLTGAGTKGLCAGGDVRSVHGAMVEGRYQECDGLFAAEYAMNAMIADYPKPYVAFMDGIVLGGGLGISGHGSHRIVTERTRLGMPETGIGFFPDVGGAHLLGRAPFGAGLHMALTGAHITGADALAFGIADHYVPAARRADLARALETLPADAAIAEVAEQAPPAPLTERRRWIESCYAHESAEEIVAALHADGDPEAVAAAGTILAKCPTSVKIALAHVRAARGAGSVHEVLERDLRLAHHLVRGPNFREGVRALLVDKDRSPHWEPAALEQVRAEDIAGGLVPFATRESRR